MKYIYIILMAISFSYYVAGVQVAYWIRYVISIAILVMCLLPEILQKKKIVGMDYFCLKNYIAPVIYIALWSMIIWCIKRPVGFTSSNITRMLSGCLNLLFSITTALAATKLFGKNAIKYSVIAIFVSIIFNTLCCINVYGISLFTKYITQAIFSTDFPYGSSLYNLGSALEVQDATLATGFYILYFIFFDNEDKPKTRIKYLTILMICSYIGFKRTEFISIIVTSIVIVVMRRFNQKRIISTIGTCFGIVCFAYVVIVKLGLFSDIVNYIGADVTGRTTVYKWLSEYFELSILYIGKGFTFVDKAMYESTGFASHNVIARMYAELGCIPFFIWLYWYLLKIPLNVLKKYNKFNKEAGIITFSCILYLFLTYFIGNSINFFCIQFSFMLIQTSLMFERKEKVKESVGGAYENCNFINAKSI